jgi:hypothetical protein
MVESERLLGEPGSARPHVLAHLAHGLRVADAPSGLGHLGKVTCGGCGHDFLNDRQVLAHVLLLVVGHHRQKRQGFALIEALQLVRRRCARCLRACGR